MNGPGSALTLPVPATTWMRGSDVAKNTCTIDGCEKPVNGRGLCGTHYARWYHHGDPHHESVILGDDPRRFWSHVDKSAECWLWTGAKGREGGYGHFWVAGRKVAAHRFAYELLVGPIPDGLVLDHLCRETLCVRPSHLEPVTQAENTRRGLRGALKERCGSGRHEWVPENLYTRPDRVNPQCLRCAELNGRFGKRAQERARASA